MSKPTPHSDSDELDEILTSNGGVCGHEYVHYLHGDKEPIKQRLTQWADRRAEKLVVEAKLNEQDKLTNFILNNSGKEYFLYLVSAWNTSRIKELQADLTATKEEESDG